MADLLIDILIPTFNRASDLKKNLELLSIYITNEIPKEQVRIIVCDNCSSDETQDIVKKAKREVDFQVNYLVNDENIGLEKNAVKVLSQAKAPYVMFLGDDDYIAEGYLSFSYSKISDFDVGAIIPGISNLNEDGSFTVGRKEDFETKILRKGYKSAHYASHLGHQMSGLILRRDNLLAHYLSHEKWRNPYLFIHFLTYCLLNYDAIYAPSYKTQITTFNSKDWGYNIVGLIDEVFKSYYPFRSKLEDTQVSDLLIRFSKMHSYRYQISLLKPLRLYRQVSYLVKESSFLPDFKKKIIIQIIKEYLLAIKKIGNG